jgi:hypothetical protein
VSYTLIACGVLSIVAYVGVCFVAITLWATGQR